jgi:hypothetical protein
VNEIAAGLLEGTFLLAPGILCLTVLSVWLGWRPIPPRGARGRRFAAALPVALAGGAGDFMDAALILFVPAAVFFIIGLTAVAVTYFRREQLSILRLMATWIIATLAAFMLIVVGVVLFTLGQGL